MLPHTILQFNQLQKFMMTYRTTNKLCFEHN